MKKDFRKDQMELVRWDEALVWYRTIRDANEADLSASMVHEWQQWYADAANRRVFDSMSRMVADGGRYQPRGRPSKEELASDRYDLSVPITEWNSALARQANAKDRFSIGIGWWSIAIAAVAAMAILLLRPLQFGFRSGPTATGMYQTGIGTVQDVHLRDGSSIILGARTKIAITFSPRRRSVSLVEGQALFRVAHDPHWPFVVAAGDGTITAVGTAFSVTRESDRVVVTVTDGTVEVSTRLSKRSFLNNKHDVLPKPNLATIRISRGQELVFGDNGKLSPIQSTDPQAAASWTHGRLRFDNQPLRYVVEAINRYYPRPIVVSSSAGALRFSGIVFTDEIDEWLQSLQGIFPVTVEARGSVLHIQIRKSMTPAPPISR